MLPIGPRARRVAPALHGLAVGSVLLCVMGCGGASSGDGGSPPPPKQITLTSAAPYNATYQGNNWVVAGVPSFTLIATGTGFTSSSVVQWNGTPLPTVYGDSTDLNATVSSTLASVAGSATISVTDASLGLTSSSLPFGIASPAAATAGVIQLVTIAPDGSPANDDTLTAPSISTTGRFIAFQSAATNLVTGPASGYQEIYERDTCIGAPDGCAPNTIHISVTYDGSPVNGNSQYSALSADGRYVAFASSATNILPSTSTCATPSACVFLRDTCSNAASTCTPGTTQIPSGGLFQMTPDGRYLAERRYC